MINKLTIHKHTKRDTFKHIRRIFDDNYSNDCISGIPRNYGAEKG